MSELHTELHRLVEERKPRGSLTSAQIVRLKVLKLVEEVAEAQACVPTPCPRGAGAAYAAQAFRERAWLREPWTRDPSDITVGGLKDELADVYIVLATLEVELSMLTGEDWSVQEAALLKARRDVARR